MKRTVCLILIVIIIFLTGCSNISNAPNSTHSYTVTDSLKSKDVKELLLKVNRYFQKNLSAGSNTWDDAVYHSGNIRAFMITGVKEFYDYSLEYAKSHHFFVNNGANTVNGDYYCISQTYLDLCKLNSKDYMLTDVFRNADYNANKRTSFDWVDLLYMSLPVFADLTQVTKDNKYIEDAYRAYLKARNILWDEEDNLWYRDARFVFGSGHVDSVTPAGKKVFWSRGNGWAFAGIAKALENMDQKSEAYKAFTKDFKLMAKALKERQREDGTWNANLADPEHYGGIETSGTSMFMYGYAVGIRLGLLDFDEYFPVLLKAYEGVKKHALSSEGRLLYVQPGSDSPQRYANYENEEKRKNATSQFAVGTYVMALAEIMRLCSDYVQPEISVPEPEFTPLKPPTLDDDYYKGKIKATATREQTGNTANKIVDKVYEDKDGYRWSADGYPQSITLELEKVISLRQITVVPYMSRAYIYKIEVSVDGVNYKKVVDNSSEPISFIFVNHEVNEDAKYIRMTVTGCKNYSGEWISINELFIYEKK